MHSSRMRTASTLTVFPGQKEVGMDGLVRGGVGWWMACSGNRLDGLVSGGGCELTE